ncbi:hypothetical protein [Pseudonocardia acaciae]|uniref:hypothetical protein n=1 Tax=Pseudonocardia acaciae TaxID=551276 RepID=UPI00048C32E7|nr:hypothetical protein [Pseudonocardia acaciae]
MTSPRPPASPRTTHHGSSANSYYETAHAGAWGAGARSTVPTGVAVFPLDVSIRTLEAEHTIVHWSEFDRGGHFAAMEAPDLLAGDIRAFFATLRRRPHASSAAMNSGG